MPDFLFLIFVLLASVSFFWAGTNAVALMRSNVRDRREQGQTPLSQPFNAMLMPGLSAEGIALRRRVWLGLFFCMAFGICAAAASYWM
ncbi:hypothetical protein [Luteibacter sp. SG786]|uniref:hypothetical protein n=1 Tax=Luteibacter sp. SG786 TaxID=2587130 RepID=UPI001420AEF0|nr:hypothetical protein [Luteibacter sp. SG786]NII53791.1 hypothetical protein [Luteibacter sp. SG786]